MAGGLEPQQQQLLPWRLPYLGEVHPSGEVHPCREEALPLCREEVRPCHEGGLLPSRLVEGQHLLLCHLLVEGLLPSRRRLCLVEVLPGPCQRVQESLGLLGALPSPGQQ